MTHRRPMTYELTCYDEAGEVIRSANPRPYTPITPDQPRELQFMELAQQIGPQVAAYSVHLLTPQETRARHRAEEFHRFARGIMSSVFKDGSALEISMMMQQQSVK